MASGSGFLELDADPVFEKRNSVPAVAAAPKPALRNGNVVKCTRTWKYETYIVEVGDLGEIVNETPDEEGEVVVRWTKQGKQGYIKPSALAHSDQGNAGATNSAVSPGRLQQSAPPPANYAPPQDTGSPTAQAGHALPPELLAENNARSSQTRFGFGARAGGNANTGKFGSGVSGMHGGRVRGVGFGHYNTSGPEKGRRGASLAEKAAKKHAARMASMKDMEDDLPDLFPDSDEEAAAPLAQPGPHTSDADAPFAQQTETVPVAATMLPKTNSSAAGPPMASNPDADEQHESVELTFQAGRIGIRYMGNIITKVTADTQAAKLGVRFGWQILSVANNQLPTNLNQTNAQKCVDVFLAQQKAEKTAYTIRFRPTDTKILVVGAGCDIVNGCYEEHGSHHGKPRYKKVGPSGIFIWWDKHSYWNMVNQVDFVKYKQNGGSKKSCYYGIQSEDGTPPTEGWMRSHLGQNPLPVLVTADST